ncbi:DgyrCDS14812 [Dimorphilus gyrociliatus]|uniref:DgyrCDS14812 n=1 Tax=Dimorphilus gyrociliatus TaxID=2664684 RepID=A0A7I8WF84_9ANNE|nr:DgyrCDS14812 [Dimorphilus gyrociliatus]
MLFLNLKQPIWKLYTVFIFLTLIDLGQQEKCQNHTTIGPPLDKKPVNLQGNDGFNMLVGFKFPCNGYINSVTIDSLGNNYPLHIGIWERLQENPLTYVCRSKIVIPASATAGIRVLNVTEKIYVKANYSISFDFLKNHKHNIRMTENIDDPMVSVLYDRAVLDIQTLKLPTGRVVKIPALQNPRHYAINFDISAEYNKQSDVCNNNITTFGSPIINRAEGGGDHLNVVVHPSFPCSGRMLSFKIFRKYNGICFIGIWRPLPDQVYPFKFKLLHIIEVENAAPLSEQTVTLSQPIPIEAGDVYSIIHKKNTIHVIANQFEKTDYPSVCAKKIFFEDLTVGYELDCKMVTHVFRIYSIEFTIDNGNIFIFSSFIIFLLDHSSSLLSFHIN